MTKEEIKVVIAEFCGCKRYVRAMDGKVFLCLKAPVGNWTITDSRPIDLVNSDVPDYPTDLNAMHEAEKLIVDWIAWRITISKIVGIGYAPDLDICEDIRAFASATASQRAEAFLKTIGKWKD